MYFPFVIHPRDAEDDNPLGLHYPFHYLIVEKMRICLQTRGNALEHFSYGLVEFLLSRIFGFQFRHKGSNVLFCKLGHSRK